MKLLFMTDIHFMLHNPKSWNSDISYLQLLINTLSDIKNFCLNNKIEHVICGGDIFHYPAQAKNSPELLNLVYDVFKSFKDSSISIYGIAGNHDQLGGSNQNLERQPLYLLDKAGVYHLLDKEPVQVGGSDPVLITGSSFYHAEADAILSLPNDTKAVTIAVGHFLFGPKNGSMHGETIFGPEYFDQANFDVLCIGHRHDDQGVITKNNKFFVAPGALTRHGFYAHDLTRQPCVTVLDIRDGIINFEPYYVPVPDFRDLFDVAQFTTRKQEQKFLHEFVLQLTSDAAPGPDNYLDILHSMNLSQEVLNKCLYYLDEN